MSAWGVGNFDNDTALDWIYELEETDDLSLVKNTIEKVLSEKYIDSDMGAEALVAIEVLARLKGNFGKEDPYSEDIDQWVKTHAIEVDSKTIDKALQAIDLIVSKKSELYELWEETDDFNAWKEEINNLKIRLR